MLTVVLRVDAGAAGSAAIELAHKTAAAMSKVPGFIEGAPFLSAFSALGNGIEAIARQLLKVAESVPGSVRDQFTTIRSRSLS